MISKNPFVPNLEAKARLLEEQILHQLGYKVWEIPKLTILEKRRLVRGYVLYQNPTEDTQDEKRIQAEELIKKRKEHHGRAKRQDNSNG